MIKKQLTIILVLVALATFTSYAYPQDIYRKGGELYLDYKGKTYEIHQYSEGWDVFRFYSLQYRPKDMGILPEGLVLILDKNGKVVKEITNSEYCPDIILYDINADVRQDLILFWYMGAHSKEVQVWINKDNKDFQKVFEEFNDKNIFFSIRDGIPTLAFKKEYPMSATNDNFSDSDYDFYGWNGETFVAKGKNFEEMVLHETSTSRPFLGYEYKNIKWTKHTPDETAESYKDEAGSGGQVDVGTVDLDGDNKGEEIKAIWGPGVSDHSLTIELYKDNVKLSVFEAPGIQPNFELKDIDGDKKLEVVIWGAVSDPKMSQLLSDESRPFEGHSSPHLYKIRIYKLDKGIYKFSKEYISKEKCEPLCKEQPKE